LALPITGARLAQVEHQKRLIEHRKQKLRSESEGLAKTLANTQITIHAKAGDQGKLFGSIGSRDIEKALAGAGFSISNRDIKLEHPLKNIGLHNIEVRLEADVKGSINVVVVPEVTETPAPAAATHDTPTQTV
jgi:large subunit ribosomal protein L9